MIHTNQARESQFFDGYLLKKITDIQYQNIAIYEEADNVSVDDLYELYEYQSLNDTYVRTQDTKVISGKKYYIQTWKTIDGNEAVLAENKTIYKGTERYHFNFSYLTNNNNMNKEMDVANTFEENVTFIIYTNDDIPIATTDSVEINDESYGIIDVYREGHEATNNPLKRPSFTTYITLKS